MIVHRLVAAAPLALILGLALGSAPQALAMGGMGGGMGGGSSSSGPQIDPQKAYQDGVAAINAHDYKTAISRLKEAQDALPHDATVNYALGIAYIGDNDPKSARRPLERSVDGDNPPADAYLQLGLVYLQLDKRDKAEDLQKDLTEIVAKCDASCGDQRRAQLQAALDSLTHALQPSAAPAGKPSGWNFPGDKAGRAAYAEAVGLINHHRYADAIAVLQRAEAASGPHPDIFNYLGFANRHLRRYDVAVGYYKQALALDPVHVGATEYLGELYLEIGRVAEAKQQLARLDELCPYGCAAREELAKWIATAQK
jgi:tetratricopeptide (TPR) repeat protein